ncbi:hypothetical protein Dda_5897 [Drechslerella dactyloides]|uniref:Chromo domain-containing protein n=1 Tax=Drechslerella dactyloides TaxID=74499 RepID=A0AAD6IYZ7_DREDA|nr:hypothetical protein Dda_5897 [Drechslerella dactyloides]
MIKNVRANARPGHGHLPSLPVGWHRFFLGHFFGDATSRSKGLYSGWPGPVPDAYTCLGFVGLTFVAFRAKGLDDADISQSFRTPREDQSWTGPTFNDDSDSDSGRNSALTRTNIGSITRAHRHTPSTPPDTGNMDHVQQKSTSPKSPRRHTEGIQPDEVVEPSDGSGVQRERPSRRHSEHHHSSYASQARAGGYEESPSSNKRRMRHSTSNATQGRSRRQYFMETTNTDELPDSNVFDDFDDIATDLHPMSAEKPPRYKVRGGRRRNSANSTLSTQSDSMPRAPSPPRSDLPNLPETPSPRKLRRRTTAPTSPSSSNRFRSLSPIADYRSTMGDASVPPFSPEFPPMSTLDPAFYPLPNTYPQTPTASHVSWSGSGYTSPVYPPTPRSPSSTVSYSSRQSSRTAPGTTAEEDIVENINGEFTVASIRSFSDSPEGRFYKVWWADTWETKASMRTATESGKYKVQEIVESTYVNGKGLYRVRWKDTWEAAQEIGDIEPVRMFWNDSQAGRREPVRRRTSSFA